MGHSDLVAAIRARLTASADPVRAAGAQAYLKSAMPQLGVRVPEVRRIVKAEVAAAPLASGDELRSGRAGALPDSHLPGGTVRRDRPDGLEACQDGFGDVACVRGNHPHRSMVGPGGRRGRPAGPAPAGTPGRADTILLRWSTDPDFWIRRASITAQLGAKANTDTGLLATVIEANLADREFFIRKAIGWALREYAKTDPAWVSAVRCRRTGPPSARCHAARRSGTCPQRTKQPALGPGSGQMTGRVVTGSSGLLNSCFVLGSRKIRYSANIRAMMAAALRARARGRPRSSVCR